MMNQKGENELLAALAQALGAVPRDPETKLSRDLGGRTRALRIPLVSAPSGLALPPCPASAARPVLPFNPVMSQNTS